MRCVRDDAQNTTNPAISLVFYNVILLLIGPPLRAPITLIMYHVGKEPGCVFSPVMGNGHGWITEPKGDQFRSPNLDMIPENKKKLLAVSDQSWYGQ